MQTGLPCFQAQTDIKELLETLGQNVVTKKRKNVEILWIAGAVSYFNLLSLAMQNIFCSNSCITDINCRLVVFLPLSSVSPKNEMMSK